MQLSALVSVAVPTLFVNSGGRNSKCLPGERGSFQEAGIVVACVGARMVKESRMEAEHMLITPDSDTAHGNGHQHGQIGAASTRLAPWARFYGLERFPSHAEAAAEEGRGRYHRIQSECWRCSVESDCVWTDNGTQYCKDCMTWRHHGTTPAHAADAASYLDGFVYKRRIRAVVEPFLVYASQMGEQHRVTVGQGAHVRVKGLGLGCWWVTPAQEALMKEVYAEVMEATQLPGIDVLEFAFFPSGDVPAGPGRIEVRATRCSFAEPVGERLLVAMYAWDSNAFPGNEWWGGRLTMTDDSAAASCSLISSLQHPGVNIERLSAESAEMLTEEGDLVTLLA